FGDRGHRLGNIRETPLCDLLESPAQRAFGEAKRDALPRYCRECEVLAMCNGGCPKYRFIETPNGEPGLNYLCAGLKRFFLHSREPLARMASREQPRAAASAKAGRNDPCPCGSGLKYKKCCALH
ncbi:MAG: SEC-C metal-binding domain-containing protein, partial [Acidobacteria bacterium]|nr:SEC-C metal-binding domain-containing protein [Acidobacteriota bacterium]